MLQELLQRLPDQFESERLIIRAPKPGDASAINTAIVESYKELKPWMPWCQSIPSLTESDSFTKEACINYQSRADLPLLIFRKKDGYFVGASGLTRIDWNVRRMEIGYWCRSSLAGTGFITEAVGRITRFAFESAAANRIEIRVDSRNERSSRVPEKLGYKLEALLRQDSLDASGEAMRDTRLYAMISLQELEPIFIPA